MLVRLHNAAHFGHLIRSTNKLLTEAPTLKVDVRGTNFAASFVGSIFQFNMNKCLWWWIASVVVVSNLDGYLGIRFVIDKEECISHKVDYGATVHFSFVVIKSEGSWHYNPDGVDLVVKGPTGDQVQDFRDKTSEKSEFHANHEGVYKFCFTNKSPYHETLDFDVHAGHFTYHDEHAKDEHFKPLFEHIGKLEEALYNIQFEQHWLEAQTERQAIVNEEMSRRAIHKALYESAALIGASILQVYLLRRLFDRKLGMSRV